MPTKNAEKIAQAAVYIDGKPIKRIQEVCACPDCLKRAAVDPEQVKKLRQINNVLKITEDTDGNIKECVQSLTEILEDLERGKRGKERKSNTIQTGNKDNL